LAAFSLRANAWFSRQLHLLIHQQREPFQETQLTHGAILFLRLQRLDHAVQPHGQQFFDHRLVQHERGPPWAK